MLWCGLNYFDVCNWIHKMMYICNRRSRCVPIGWLYCSVHMILILMCDWYRSWFDIIMFTGHFSGNKKGFVKFTLGMTLIWWDECISVHFLINMWLYGYFVVNHKLYSKTGSDNWTKCCLISLNQYWQCQSRRNMPNNGVTRSNNGRVAAICITQNHYSPTNSWYLCHVTMSITRIVMHENLALKAEVYFGSPDGHKLNGWINYKPKSTTAMIQARIIHNRRVFTRVFRSIWLIES